MSIQKSNWAVGWTAFAGLMMVLQGFWWVIAGLAALFEDTFFVVTQDWIFKFDVTAWGWIHLIVGLVVLFAGFGLFAAATWARVVGVVVAVVTGIIAFGWLPYYPVWGILLVTISVAVIWALTVHGDDIAQP
ncbi:MAG: hypothetical protein GY926_19870 [bacterium]|nr:hypothetical protein [bacterium]MCP4967477.1 hypothetical protein [bacterium]